MGNLRHALFERLVESAACVVADGCATRGMVQEIVDASVGERCGINLTDKDATTQLMQTLPLLKVG